jgi:hypothetical protein
VRRAVAAASVCGSRNHGTLGGGDVLTVTRLDRLARSTRDLLNTFDAIARKGAGVKSLADAWADTTTPHGRLILTVLGGIAEFERELFRARTADGRDRAKARGIHMGRPSKLTPHRSASRGPSTCRTQPFQGCCLDLYRLLRGPVSFCVASPAWLRDHLFWITPKNPTPSSVKLRSG